MKSRFNRQKQIQLQKPTISAVGPLNGRLKGYESRSPKTKISCSKLTVFWFDQSEIEKDKNDQRFCSSFILPLLIGKINRKHFQKLNIFYIS